MTIAEKYRNEGWVEGREEGREEGIAEGREEGREEGIVEGAEKGANAGANKIIELIKSGLSPDEALRKFNEESKILVTSLVKSHA